MTATLSVQKIDGGTRRRLIAIVSTVVALNVLGWGLYATGQANSQSSAALAGAGVLAFVLGVRHAFDADHIATIDDCTRLLVRRGERPMSLGLFFALGHSSVVLILALVVILFTKAADSEAMGVMQSFGGVLSSAVAATFLWVVGTLNLRVFGSLWRVREQARVGSLAPAELDELAAGRGVFSRLFGRRMSSALTSSSQMFPVGFVFGLGLGTASEVALLGLSATAAMSGSVSLLGLLALPVLFAAGMALFDTANSLMMVHMYSSTTQNLRRFRFNLATTLVTGLIGIGVGAVYLAGLLVDQGHVDALAPLASVADHFEVIGYAIVTAYLVVWITTVLRRRHSTTVGVEPSPVAS